MEIQQVRSDIEKHKDALGDLQMNQRFILELTPADFRQEREARVTQKREKAFREWRQRYLIDESQDDIIFGEDEEIHEGIKLDFIEESGKSNTGASFNKSLSSNPQSKKAQSKAVSRQNCSEAWLAQRFEQLLKLDLIELDDDYYNDKLFFE
jgi:hypothetical protein